MIIIACTFLSWRGGKVIYVLYTFLDNHLDRFYCTLCLYFNSNRTDALYTSILIVTSQIVDK